MIPSFLQQKHELYVKLSEDVFNRSKMSKTHYNITVTPKKVEPVFALALCM
jgi:hypothetical protein